MTCLDIWWKTLHFCILHFPFKISLFEKLYQTLVTVFHHNIKNLEVRQKQYATHCNFNSSRCLICDETLCLVIDILHQTHTLNSVNTLANRGLLAVCYYNNKKLFVVLQSVIVLEFLKKTIKLLVSESIRGCLQCVSSSNNSVIVSFIIMYVL